MLANLVCSLIKHKRVTTTLAKAKAARSVAEKMVTLGKSGTIHAPTVAARLHARGPRCIDKDERQNGGETRTSCGFFLRNRARVQGTQRRLHAHRQNEPAPGRCRPARHFGMGGFHASGAGDGGSHTRCRGQNTGTGQGINRQGLNGEEFKIFPGPLTRAGFFVAGNG